MYAGKTFKQHLIELAETFGTVVATDEGPALPDNAYELDKLKRKFNEGLSLIALANPEGWFCLRRIEEITIGGDSPEGLLDAEDSSRYRLAPGVSGEPEGDWEWSAPGENRCGDALSTGWNEVSRLLANDDCTGEPQLVSVQPATRSNNEQGAPRVYWTMRVYPRPDMEYLMCAQFTIAVEPLVENEQLHPFGALMDPLVQAAAKWASVMNDSTNARYPLFQEQYESRLAEARLIDRKNAPKRLMERGGIRGGMHSMRRFTFNGANPNG